MFPAVCFSNFWSFTGIWKVLKSCSPSSCGLSEKFYLFTEDKYFVISIIYITCHCLDLYFIL